MTNLTRVRVLSGNALKLIACLSMVFDHVGFFLFPKILFFRMLGRIARPLFSFFIAEGCFYTRNRVRHLTVIAAFGVLMQAVLFFATGMTDLSIFIHFSFSILLIDLFDGGVAFLQRAKDGKRFGFFGVICLLGFVALSAGLHLLCLKTGYFYANYGFQGIMCPVLLYLAKRYGGRFAFPLELLLLAGDVLLLAWYWSQAFQLFGLVAVVLLLFYNGTRGKYNLKYFFYVFYPLHLVIIAAIAALV